MRRVAFAAALGLLVAGCGSGASVMSASDVAERMRTAGLQYVRVVSVRQFALAGAYERRRQGFRGRDLRFGSDRVFAQAPDHKMALVVVERYRSTWEAKQAAGNDGGELNCNLITYVFAPPRVEQIQRFVDRLRTVCAP